MLILVKKSLIKVCKCVLFVYITAGLSIFTGAAYGTNRVFGVCCMLLFAMTILYLLQGEMKK